MNMLIPLSWLGVWLVRILGSDLSGSGERWVGASATGLASTNLHSRFRRGVWTADFPVAAFRVVFLALFCCGLGWLDFSTYFGTPNISTLCKIL